MEKLNVLSKKLGKPKGKIKDMCKSGEIIFEVVNGVYYVDVEDVKQKLRETPFKPKEFKDRRFYKSVIPSDMYYISRLSDELEIDGRWLNQMVNDIVGYWNDVGRNHKVLEYFGSFTPIEYRVLPINYFPNQSDYENLFGGELDENSMFIWIKQYSGFSMDSINEVDGSFHSHTYKKEFKVGILNPSTKQIKVFDIDTKIYEVDGEMEWYKVVNKYTINEKMIDYNTTDVLDIGILSKPLSTSHLISTNNTNVISWEKKIS